jgi:tRNA(fMet)-specific endonuclease VapC
MQQTYMLDTSICSFIMREHPIEVLQRLQEQAMKSHIVISAVIYAEMRYGAAGKKASPKHTVWIDQFVSRLDGILPWDVAAIDAAALINKQFAEKGTPIGINDMGIAGHAISQKCILVTNNSREFERVSGLQVEGWVNN